MDANCACFKWRCASRFGGHRIEHGTLVDRISHQAQSLYRHFGTTPVHRAVTDCDAVYRRALAAGGKSIQELQTQFYGDRTGAVQDAQGNDWWIASRVEDVSPEELQRRAAAAGR